MNIGTPEMMLILGAALFLFGGKKLPELARGLGKGIREFKDASDGVKREIHNSINRVEDDMKVDIEPDHHYKQPEIPQNTTEGSAYSDPYHHYYAPPANSEAIESNPVTVAPEEEPASQPETGIVEASNDETDKEKINSPVTNRA
jgi:sec-independent protein translocase protein TatA